MRKNISNALTFLALAGLALLSGCKDKSGEVTATPTTVEVVPVEQKDVPIYRDWVGTLESEVNATISAQVTGYLISRNYQEGSPVTNGQVLFQIDPTTFQAEYDKAKAAQEKWALTVARYIPLAKTEALSQQELDDAVQNEKAAAAQVQQAKANLDFTTIRSPIDGIAGLYSSDAQIGNLVGPGNGALTTVATTHPMRAYFSVSQSLLLQIQERMLAEGRKLGSGQGPELELILANGSLYPHKGRVRFANNQVDVKTGTVRVVGEFPNPNRLLVSGMFVRVRALLETLTNAIVVPQRAVTDMQGRSLIAIVGADNKISIRPVEAGETIGPNWVISGDVKAGDKIVAEGVQKVREGAVVNPVPFTEKTAAAPSAAGTEGGKD